MHRLERDDMVFIKQSVSGFYGGLHNIAALHCSYHHKIHVQQICLILQHLASGNFKVL